MEQQDYARAQKYVEDAIEMTLPYFSIETLDKYLLGEEEWTLIIMWLQCGLYLGNGEVHKQCMTLVSVLDKRQLDVEMQIALYPKLTWLLAESLRQNDKEEQAESAVRKTLDLLVENTSLFFLPQILEILMHIAVKKMDKAESARIKQQIDALKWSYESSGMRMPDAGINLWVTNRQNKIYLIAEAVRQERKQSNLTQDKLAEKAGLDIKTLSRIENGANLPKPGTFRKLMDAIDCEYDIYRTNLITDDFSLLELEWEIAGEIMRENYQGARELLKEMERGLLLDFKENKQYLLYMTIILDVRENRLDLYEAIDLCVQAFEVTRVYEPKCFEIVVLSVQEIIIINFIAKLYRKFGKERKAILLLEYALAGFDNSKVEDRYHYRELSLLLESLSIYCEISDELDKALAYCKRGINLQLICGRGGLLGSFLMQKICIEERIEKDRKNCQMNYCRVYRLLELLKMEKDKYALEKYYSKQFRRNIFDDVNKN
ncbi:MAG: helix-turn-helix domain-containing protein [Roseburia sp.]|nr:helix-turn-helix domain-containing protein [Roseburia sp.]